MSSFSTAKQGASVRCPSCGSTLKFDPETQKLVCDSCGSSFSEEELKSKSSNSEKTSETFDDELKDYHCPSCGAEILADEHTTTEFCMYCGNPVVFKGRVSGQMKPNSIIPFSISKERAKEILKDYLKQHSFVPSSFFKEANLEKISGVYYPFWEADIDTNSSILAEGTTSSTWITGNTEHIETRYYDIERVGDIHFEDISVNAFSGADKKLIESVLPFPIKNHKDFKMEYLSGFHAKKNDLKLKDVSGEIKSKMQNYSNSVLLDTVSGYEGLTVKNSSSKVLNEKYDYTLLPIWIVNYKYFGKNWTFAINGVTGKVFGEIPISRPKLGLTFAGVASAVFALLALLGGMLI